ncbi:MAG: cytochrome c maturation protein CcmE [Alphaproteobacteria bacterium]|nr:cytochrome c maturation protein CcmE [Alphaproteobacteria bacterium]
MKLPRARTAKRRRLMILLLAGLGLGTAAALTLTAFDDHLVFFHTPSDIAAHKVPVDRQMRIGGLVEEGSVERVSGSATIRFRVTDLEHAIPVTYEGVLPDLFREGQGVVANGKLGADGTFRANEVLAKHDENYMPAEVAEALKRAGRWQEGAAKPK